MVLIKSVRGKKPTWGERCFIAENATLAGDITMGDDCSVWFGAVIRADVAGVTIGNEVNIQDLACVHQTAGRPVTIEDGVSIGHGAVVHAATIRSGALIGMNATVLDLAEVGENAVVAAGSVVLAARRYLLARFGAAFLRTSWKDAEPGFARAYADNYLETKKWY